LPHVQDERAWCEIARRRLLPASQSYNVVRVGTVWRILVATFHVG
jgi:hypothetical protein